MSFGLFKKTDELHEYDCHIVLFPCVNSSLSKENNIYTQRNYIYKSKITNITLINEITSNILKVINATEHKNLGELWLNPDLSIHDNWW